MKNLGDKIYKLYLNNYQFLVSILLILVIFYFLGNAYKNGLIRDLLTYVQAIFIGLITFSIPFLWNAYQRVLEIKNKIRGEDIDSILAKEFYKKAVKYFEAFLLYPTAIITFLGVTISPFVTPLLVVIFVIISCIFFLMQTKIYDWIETKTSTNLKDFINLKDPKNLDLINVFKELLQKKDVELEKDLSIRASSLLDTLSQKINNLIVNDNLSEDNNKILRKYLSDFYGSLNNRSLPTIFFSKFFENFLRWHYIVWRKEIALLNSGDTNIWFEYNQTLIKMNAILSYITEKVLTDGGMEAFYFFDEFKKHVEQYKEEVITLKKNSRDIEHSYAEYTLVHFYQVFFSKISDSPDNFSIWEHNFPKEWRVTENPFADHKKIIPRVTLKYFIDWATGRIRSGKKDWDKELDDVSENLFPTVDPVRWARILIFILSPYDPKNRVGYIIGRPWNFGLISRSHSYSGYEEDDKTFQKKYEEHILAIDKNEREATSKLAVALFGKILTKEKLDGFTAETENLKYPPDSDEEKKRQYILKLFEELRDYLSSQSK
jgi:hypothetical protein